MKLITKLTITESQLEKCFLNVLNNLGVKDVGTLAEIIENVNKYRWHNLRKNPTDLPRENGMYWVCVEGFDTKYTSTYWDGYVWWGYSVIAWKEIELFGEV